eukprot:4081350-Prymnesium_polylepis.1
MSTTCPQWGPNVGLRWCCMGATVSLRFEPAHGYVSARLWRLETRKERLQKGLLHHRRVGDGVGARPIEREASVHVSLHVVAIAVDARDATEQPLGGHLDVCRRVACQVEGAANPAEARGQCRIGRAGLELQFDRCGNELRGTATDAVRRRVRHGLSRRGSAQRGPEVVGSRAACSRRPPMQRRRRPSRGACRRREWPTPSTRGRAAAASTAAAASAHPTCRARRQCSRTASRPSTHLLLATCYLLPGEPVGERARSEGCKRRSRRGAQRRRRQRSTASARRSVRRVRRQRRQRGGGGACLEPVWERRDFRRLRQHREQRRREAGVDARARAGDHSERRLPAATHRDERDGAYLWSKM